MVLMLTGCSKVSHEKSQQAKEIIENRKIHNHEIHEMTIECIKSANTLKSLTAAGNDSKETVEACTFAAQEAYGAYSPWFETHLYEIAYGSN